MSRIMAIDYGDVRIGIALTDPLQIISSGYKTLSNCENIFDEIYNICREKEVDTIVIGIPYAEQSEIGYAAKKVIIFMKDLLNKFNELQLNIPIYEHDERYTTKTAHSVMSQMKINKKNKRKKIVDQIAAISILDEFRESRVKKLFDLNNYLECIE